MYLNICVIIREEKERNFYTSFPPDKKDSPSGLRQSYIYVILRGTIKKPIQETHSKLLQINQNGILKYMQVTHMNAGERNQRNKKQKKQTICNSIYSYNIDNYAKQTV